jgi:hypothetical protein
MDEEQVFEKVPSPSFGLYYTCIQPIAHVAYEAIPLVTTCSSLNSPTRLCVHLVRHCREAIFEGPRTSKYMLNHFSPWTHSRRHLCSSNHCVGYIMYFQGSLSWKSNFINSYGQGCRILLMWLQLLAWPWGLKFSTLSHMSILKMVWLDPLSRGLNSLQDLCLLNCNYQLDVGVM